MAGQRQIVMVHDRLVDTPHHEVPQGYSIRWYREGDEYTWLSIKERSDTHHRADMDYYWRAYGDQRELLSTRQAFLHAPDGSAIGTATAWFENLMGTPLGKVNWMLLLPEARGRGLSKPLLSAICRRLLEHGHESAMLYTLPARVAAINLYRGFGFRPFIRDAADQQAWDTVPPT